MNLIARLQMLFAVKTETALNNAEDPRETLEHAYNRQRDLLRKVKQGLVEVGTARRQIESQVTKLRARIPQLEDQARRALAADREDLARIALNRKQACLAECSQLDHQLCEVSAEEHKLTQAEEQFAAQLNAFRARRQTLAARYTVAESQIKINESFTGLAGEFSELGASLERAEEKIGRMQARAGAIDDLVDGGNLLLPDGRDPIDHELALLSNGQAVEEELAKLKGEA